MKFEFFISISLVKNPVVYISHSQHIMKDANDLSNLYNMGIGTVVDIV